MRQSTASGAVAVPGGRGGPGGPPPLIFRPNWGPKDRKNLFWRPHPPPPPPFVRVWIRHWEELYSILEKKECFFRYFWQNPKKTDVLNIYNHSIRRENERFFQKRGVAFFPNATFPGPFSFQYVLLNSSAFNWSLARLRVVPMYFSGIVERAKRERAWKSPNRV